MCTEKTQYYDPLPSILEFPVLTARTAQIFQSCTPRCAVVSGTKNVSNRSFKSWKLCGWAFMFVQEIPQSHDRGESDGIWRLGQHLNSMFLKHLFFFAVRCNIVLK